MELRKGLSSVHLFSNRSLVRTIQNCLIQLKTLGWTRHGWVIALCSRARYSTPVESLSAKENGGSYNTPDHFRLISGWTSTTWLYNVILDPFFLPCQFPDLHQGTHLLLFPVSLLQNLTEILALHDCPPDLSQPHLSAQEEEMHNPHQAHFLRRENCQRHQHHQVSWKLAEIVL